jgi:hypothetical protein
MACTSMSLTVVEMLCMRGALPGVGVLSTIDRTVSVLKRSARGGRKPKAGPGGQAGGDYKVQRD